MASKGLMWYHPPPPALSHQQSPSTSASIPSRYQTFFYATTEKKGFNSRATRFTTPTNVVSPYASDPASYTLTHTNTTPIHTHTHTHTH